MRAEVSVGPRNLQHVESPHPRGQKRLMRIAERRIGDQQTVVLDDPFAETPGAQFFELLPRARPRRLRFVKLRDRRRLSRDADGLGFQQRVAIHEDVGQKSQQPRGPILALGELEQLGRLVQKPRRAFPGDKRGVGDQVKQERNVRFDAADTKLLQAAFHVSRRVDKASSPGNHLDQ